MKVFKKDGSEVDIALENELVAKVYANSYKTSGDYINFEDARYALNVDSNYYLLFATTGDVNVWFGIVEWRSIFNGNTNPKVIPIITNAEVYPVTYNNTGTIAFSSIYTYYQVTPIGM